MIKAKLKKLFLISFICFFGAGFLSTWFASWLSVSSNHTIEQENIESENLNEEERNIKNTEKKEEKECKNNKIYHKEDKYTTVKIKKIKSVFPANDSYVLLIWINKILV